jgi:ubiquinone/menaquinone biosynthesis methyltransferase
MAHQDPSPQPVALTAPTAASQAARLVPALHERAGAAEGHAVAVRQMFDRISPTYDLLNRLMSFGTDRAWRKRALDLVDVHAPPGPLFDCCAGTLDLAAEMAKRWPTRPLLAGDFAPQMLLAGRAKLPRGASAVVCDAMRLPFADATLAAITNGFGMRNLSEPRRGVEEAHRTLVPSGVFVVLELFRPSTPVTRLFHAVYGRMLLPAMGRLVSGDGEAYRYLSRSMRGFLTRAEMEGLLRDAGFREVHGVDLTLGIASLVWGIK